MTGTLSEKQGKSRGWPVVHIGWEKWPKFIGKIGLLHVSGANIGRNGEAMTRWIPARRGGCSAESEFILPVVLARSDIQPA